MGMYVMNKDMKAIVASNKAKHSRYVVRKPTNHIHAILEKFANGDMKVYTDGKVEIIHKAKGVTRTYWEKLPNGKVRVHKAVNVRPIGKASKAA